MPPTSKLTDEAQVTAHIQKLDPSLAVIVQALREIIMQCSPEIAEHIKWNSPAFYYTGNMPPSDPKTYSRDIVVLNLHRGYVLMVFPVGAKVKDATGILEGNYPDGRRMVTIKNLAALRAKEKDLRWVIQEWVKTV